MSMSIGMSLHCNPHMAEIELNVMIGQCLNRRIGSLAEVETEVSAGRTHRDNLEAKSLGSSQRRLVVRYVIFQKLS